MEEQLFETPLPRPGSHTIAAPVLHFLDRLERGCASLTRVLASLCVLGMLGMAALTMADTLMRWLADRQIPALNEVVAMFFAVAIAACIPAGISRGVNLQIDLVARWVTGRFGACFQLLGGTILCLFYGILAWQILAYAGRLAEEGRTTQFHGWPLAPFIYGIGALLGLAAAVQMVVMLNKAARVAAIPPTPIPAPVRIVTACVAVPLIALGIYAIADFDGLATWAQGHIGLTVALSFAAMWLLTLPLIPIAAVMGLTGIVGAALFIGMAPSLSGAATEVTGFLTNSDLATLPLFLMMGSFAAVANLSEDVYQLAHVLLGRFRGGLAMATIGGCAGFGALTGSSLATSVIMGRVALPEMLNRGYAPALATGCCAAGGTLGALMPPASGILILFALLSEASIGQLFAAALIPGLLAITLYFITVWLYVFISPRAAPVVKVSAPGELRSALARCGFAFFLFASVLGGIYSGVFTITEAASLGAFEAFLFAALRGKLGGGRFWLVMAEVTAATAMIYGLIFGAQIFALYIGASGLTESATSYIQGLHLNPLVVITLILVIYLALGSLMESFAVMVITVPIITPLILNMGYDLAWWGIINLCVVETGLIHPPLGLNVFVLKGMQPDVPMWTIYKGVFPFVFADLLKLALLVLFPGITLWLGSALMH